MVTLDLKAHGEFFLSKSDKVVEESERNNR